MRYSKLVDGPIRIPRTVEHPTLDGGAVIQKLGVKETVTYRYYWITKEELQAELDSLLEQAWVLDGEPSLTPVAPPLDLYNANVKLHRLVPS